jgi:3-methyladenine DNA glycosylase/8-oxoguanine DNA glycosylase
VLDAVPRRILRLAGPLDLALTLGPLRRAAQDPSTRITSDEVWRASRTPEGPATLHLRRLGVELEVEAWGPGADWATERAATLIGEGDNPEDFRPQLPLLRDLHRRFSGLRIPRSEAVFEAVVPTVLEQKVTTVQARVSYRRLLLELGTPAPGPLPLRLPPGPEKLAATPYWTFHHFGVERRRADVIRRAALSARRLEETVAMSAADAQRRILAFPGLGPWSAAEVALVALGDADAVSLNDVHLPHLASWALAGEARGSDDRMLELLEPYRGHRGRVLRLLVVAGIGAPRFGPRRPVRWIQHE